MSSKSNSSSGDKGYSYTGSGTNSDGNHYCARVSDTTGSSGYHYSNTDGSYYYSNTDGSTYYNNGGSSTYTSPSGQSYSKKS